MEAVCDQSKDGNRMNKIVMLRQHEHHQKQSQQGRDQLPCLLLFLGREDRGRKSTGLNLSFRLSNTDPRQAEHF